MAHRGVYIAGLVIAWIVFAVMIFFNALAATDLGQDWGIFNNNTGDIASLWETELTPSGWTFSIWGAIYAWNGLWLIYASTTFCRRSYDGDSILPVIPAALYFVFSLANGANIGWLFVWDRQELIASPCVLVVLPICLWICIGLACYGLAKNFVHLKKSSLNADICLDRLFVQNGLGTYATWTTIATLVNLSSVLGYEKDVSISMEDGDTICLSILAGLLIFYFLLDNIALDNYTRYLITPYLVVPYALAGIMDKNWDTESRNWMFSMALFATGCAFFVGKLIVMTWRIITKPIAEIVFTPTTLEHTSRDYFNLS